MQFSGRTFAILLFALPGLSGAAHAQDDPTPPPTEDVRSGTRAVTPTETGERSELMDRAMEHYFAKRYHVARRLFERVLEEEPENHEAYLYSGDIYLVLGEYERAEENYQIALDLSPEPARELFRLGQARYLSDRADEAADAFLWALKANPEMRLCYFYLGLIEYHLRHNREKTISYWEKYREVYPDDPQGPAIDRALELLRDPAFPMPGEEENGEPQIPGADAPVVEYRPGDPETERIHNESFSIIERDEL